MPSALAFDSSGNIFVADYFNHKIRKITATGLVSTIAGNTAGFADGQGNNAQFNFPTQLAFDSSGNIFVTDYRNNKIRKITATGLVSTIAVSYTHLTLPTSDLV